MSKSEVYWGAFVFETIDYFLRDKLSSSDYQIFFLMCREMGKEDNQVRLKQIDIKTILEDRYGLKKGKPTISKSIKKLRSKEYIVKLPQTGYMVNPSLFYTGRPKYLPEKIDNFQSYLERDGKEDYRLSLDLDTKEITEF